LTDLPPVVLVHGFAGSARRTWQENGWIDILADEGREAVAVDLLGHGTAPKPHDPAAYEGLADHLAASLPPGPIDAVGFSLGAQNLLALAVRDPSGFRRLVVAGVGDDLFDPPPADALADALERDELPDDPFVRHLLDLANAPDVDRRALAACLRRARRPLDPAELAAVDVPVLVVLGERDHLGPPDRLLAALPRAELVTLRGVDHAATPKAMGFLDAAIRWFALN
jgi:pimeloyl-ACP methyl ester carboxylesterase